MVVNTGGSHADLTKEYASIPQEMKSVAQFFNKNTLREVNPEEFTNRISEVRHALQNDRAVLRAYHYFEENQRVDAMYQALTENNFSQYLNLVSESGSSSFKYLQNVYTNNNPASQGIALGYALTENFIKNNCSYNGAFRIQGGGFAGTIEAYIPKDKTEEYKKNIERLFGKGSCLKLQIRHTPTSRVN